MVNYSLKYGVAEVARIFDVDKNTVKSWVYHFPAYLNSQANPEKGFSRIFTIEDIRVLAYVNMHWENYPDLEYIKYGLKSNNHWDNEPIDNTILSLIPIFREMPEAIDESWRGVVFGGEFKFTDIFETAKSFKLAGDKLVDIAHENYEERELFQPAIYNYRHAIELYIKAVSGVEKTHDLKVLKERLNRILKEKFNAVVPPWFDNIIEAFNYTDPKSTAFRYGTTVPNEELYADLKHIKTLMNRLSESFHTIREEIESR
ncbi:hypothetical protein MKJ04_09870 [Pontibacter sp. E15-1]|uniref:hypothetical protein n=1 Tax=Pontibacter sp. E15-1 TaxID=2919918 RepID=UPI001F4FF184|nr:hypothetical protein [Pontibacter sp. E15-1]MCJ8165148.1 hypothetical protein [Pontibacter sp. E15-1]